MGTNSSYPLVLLFQLAKKVHHLAPSVCDSFCVSLSQKRMSHNRLILVRIQPFRVSLQKSLLRVSRLTYALWDDLPVQSCFCFCHKVLMLWFRTLSGISWAFSRVRFLHLVRSAFVQVCLCTYHKEFLDGTMIVPFHAGFIFSKILASCGYVHLQRFPRNSLLLLLLVEVSLSLHWLVQILYPKSFYGYKGIFETRYCAREQVLWALRCFLRTRSCLLQMNSPLNISLDNTHNHALKKRLQLSKGWI